MTRTCKQHQVAKCEECRKARFLRYSRKDHSIPLEEAMRTFRQCSVCKETKVLLDFFRNKGSNKGYRYICKVCSMKKDVYTEKRQLSARKCNLKRTFGLSIEAYNALLEKQKSLCAICKTHSDDFTINFAVDHDRSCCPSDKSCGKCIRGLLCTSCNNGIGRFKDNLDRIASAYTYLKEYKSSTSARQPLQAENIA